MLNPSREKTFTKEVTQRSRVSILEWEISHLKMMMKKEDLMNIEINPIYILRIQRSFQR